MTQHYFQRAVIDADGIPAAIVAVSKGNPLVLLVSEKTMDKFNSVKERLGLTHIQLANQLKDAVWAHSGQFHENSVLEHLRCLENGF